MVAGLEGLTDFRNYARNMPLDIFTDTSTTAINTVRGQVQVVCSGFMALYGFVPVHTSLSVYIDEPTVYGEAKGIEAAVSWAKWFLGRSLVRPPVRFFSDSLPTLQKISTDYKKYTENIQNGRDCIKNVNMRNKFSNYTSDIFTSIFNSGLEIYMYHVSGHMPVYDSQLFGRKFKEYKNKFMHNNRNLLFAREYGNLCNYNGLMYLGTYNNVIDIATRNFLFQYKPFIENDVNILVNQGYLLGNNKIHSTILWPVNVNALIGGEEPNPVATSSPANFDVSNYLLPQY